MIEQDVLFFQLKKSIKFDKRSVAQIKFSAIPKSLSKLLFIEPGLMFGYKYKYVIVFAVSSRRRQIFESHWSFDLIVLRDCFINLVLRFDQLRKQQHIFPCLASGTHLVTVENVDFSANEFLALKEECASLRKRIQAIEGEMKM